MKKNILIILLVLVITVLSSCTNSKKIEWLGFYDIPFGISEKSFNKRIKKYGGKLIKIGGATFDQCYYDGIRFEGIKADKEGLVFIFSTGFYSIFLQFSKEQNAEKAFQSFLNKYNTILRYDDRIDQYYIEMASAFPEYHLNYDYILIGYNSTDDSTYINFQAYDKAGFERIIRKQ